MVGSLQKIWKELNLLKILTLKLMWLILLLYPMAPQLWIVRLERDVVLDGAKTCPQSLVFLK
jgi:hypothetical protein